MDLKTPERCVAITGIAVLSVIAVAGFSLAIYAAWLFHDMPDAADLVNYRPPTSMPLCWKKFLYSAARNAFTSWGGICS